jgi:glycerophosphoryl diester phosphodiesterase
VRLTADGKLAVIHDGTVDRTTNGVGRVADLTLEDIQRLRIPGGERVPSLEEVFEWNAGRAFLHVEVKDPAAMEPAVGLMAAGRIAGRVSSFWHEALVVAKKIAPGVQRGVLYACAPLDALRFANETGSVAIHPGSHYVTPGLVASAHAAGLLVCVWTADKAGEIAALSRMGVDELVTNVPDVAFSVLKDLAGPAAAPREKSEEEKRMDAQRAEIQRLMKEKPGGDPAPRKPGQRPAW